MNEQTLDRLNCFVAVADAGSISAAAETLNMSCEELADNFAELEKELQVSLALRTMHTVRLTKAGQSAYRAAVATLAGASAFEGLDDEPHDEAPTSVVQGQVSVTLPTELAAHWLPPRLAKVRRQHPGLSVHVDACDAPHALRDSAFDIGVRTAYQLPAVKARGEALRLVLAARRAPSVDVTRHGVMLTDTPLLNGAYAEIAVARDPGSGRVRPLQALRGLSVNNRDAAIAMARSGLGAVLATESALAHDLATGTLEAVLPEWDFGSVAVSVSVRDKTPSEATKALATSLLPTSRKAPRGALFLP